MKVSICGSSLLFHGLKFKCRHDKSICAKKFNRKYVLFGLYDLFNAFLNTIKKGFLIFSVFEIISYVEAVQAEIKPDQESPSGGRSAMTLLLTL